jgi:hypothetical protein
MFDLIEGINEWILTVSEEIDAIHTNVYNDMLNFITFVEYCENQFKYVNIYMVASSILILSLFVICIVLLVKQNKLTKMVLTTISQKSDTEKKENE